MVAVNEPVTMAYFRQDAAPRARPRIPGMLESSSPKGLLGPTSVLAEPPDGAPNDHFQELGVDLFS